MLTKLAIWYLRRKKNSVLIGYDLKGGLIVARNNDAFVYNNSLIKVEYRNSDNESLEIPEGKFSYVKEQFN